jgi:hypothetical protein
LHLLLTARSYQTTNDPKTDPALQDANPGSHAGGREPYVPSAGLASNLEQPKTRKEVRSTLGLSSTHFRFQTLTPESALCFSDAIQLEFLKASLNKED